MPSRVLSPTAPPPPGAVVEPGAPPTAGSGPGAGLLVVGDHGDGSAEPGTGPDAVPGWAARWCRSRGWELSRHVATGPRAAEGAARPGVRVLALRPAGVGGSGRVVAALRGLPDDAAVVADAAACAAGRDVGLRLVHAVPRSFAGRSVGLSAAVAHGRRLLEAAARVAAVAAPDVVVDTHLARVRPHELVGELLDAGLLVVGGPRRPAPDGTGPHGTGPDRTRPDRSRPGGIGPEGTRPGGIGPDGPGLVARSALHHAPCPVLLVPR